MGSGPSNQQVAETATNDTVPTVDVVAYAPAPRRILFRAPVRCPHCEGLHVHMSPDFWELCQSLRRASCGYRYRLKVVLLVTAEVPG